MDSCHFEVKVIVLVGILGHDIDKVIPLALWNLKTSNGWNAYTDILHQILITLCTKRIQKRLFDLVSDYLVGFLEPDALIEFGLAAHLCTKVEGVLEKDGS